MPDKDTKFSVLDHKGNSLDELGISEGISEVIVTTEKDGRPNAAPVGIIRRGESLRVRLFKDSHTYENVIAKKQLVANVVCDPWLVVEAALSDLSEDHFQDHEDLPVLKDACAWALFDCEIIGGNPLVVPLKLVRGEVLKREVHAINRGTNAVVEAAVHATRYLVFGRDEQLIEIKRLMRIVERCGGPRDLEAMKSLFLHLGI